MEQYSITPEGPHTLLASNQDVLLYEMRLAQGLSNMWFERNNYDSH
jgi:hypothetical protein